MECSIFGKDRHSLLERTAVFASVSRRPAAANAAAARLWRRLLAAAAVVAPDRPAAAAALAACKHVRRHEPAKK